MIDLYGLGSSGIPLEYSAELRRLQQQQMVAQGLLQQSQDPIQTNQMAGGLVVPVSPFQGLGKVAQAYVAARMMQGGNDGYRAMGEKYTADQNAAIEKVKSALAPRTLPDASAGPPATMPRTIDEQRQGLVDAYMSQFPAVRNFATQRGNELNQQENREDNQVFKAQEAQLNREQRQHERELAVEERKRQEVIAETVRQQQFQQQKELKQMIASGAGQSPYFQPVQTNQGVMSFNARTGRMEPVNVNGAPVVGAQFDPALQGNLAGAKAGGKELGEAGAKAKLDLPGAIDKAALASQQIDELLSHPGFSSTVGATLRPGARLVDGTPEADFTKRLDQLKGGAFLQAFESLKGGGQITEAEGKKATEAISRMDKAQSEKEFVNAAREFQGFINKGVERARVKAGGAPSAQPKGPSIDDLLNKYK
jgi:hypothetical protein